MNGRRIILYIEPETLMGAGYLRGLLDTPMKIGTWQVGRVVEVREDGPQIGLVIEWDAELEVATLLGGNDGRSTRA